ncbi:MAG: rhodanese-like domain-containing protein [Halobacteriota archaeon]
MVGKNQVMRDKAHLVYLTPAELARKLRAQPACLVLDVRDSHELEGELGRLPGAVNIPLKQLEQRSSELSTQERREIVIVCRSGQRSEVAAQILQKSEFEQLFILKGGMTAWRNAQRSM